MQKFFRGKSDTAKTGVLMIIPPETTWRKFTVLILFNLLCGILIACCIFASRPEDARETGIASWYGKKFHGRITTSGERYDMFKLTAAHKTLPLGSRVKVTNLDNGKSVTVRINDRGPFVEGRIIDLSYAAALKLGIVKTGTARVKLRLLD